MPGTSLKERVAALEQEVARLKAQLGNQGSSAPWWEKIYGSFANDPMYDEAMKLGREYRESQPLADEDEPAPKH